MGTPGLRVFFKNLKKNSFKNRSEGAKNAFVNEFLRYFKRYKILQLKIRTTEEVLKIRGVYLFASPFQTYPQECRIRLMTDL